MFLPGSIYRRIIAWNRGKESKCIDLIEACKISKSAEVSFRSECIKYARGIIAGNISSVSRWFPAGIFYSFIPHRRIDWLHADRIFINRFSDIARPIFRGLDDFIPLGNFILNYSRELKKERKEERNRNGTSSKREEIEINNAYMYIFLQIHIARFHVNQWKLQWNKRA